MNRANVGSAIECEDMLFEALWDYLDCCAAGEQLFTFHEAGVLVDGVVAKDPGVVLTLEDGLTFHISIVRVK